MTTLHGSRLAFVVSVALGGGCGARDALLPGEGGGGATASGPATSAQTGATINSTAVGGDGGGPTDCPPDCRPGEHLWSKGFGDRTAQMATSVATDADGNVVITGFSNGLVNFGGGDLDVGPSYGVFVAKFDASGNHLWSKLFGEDGSHVARGIAVDAAGNVVVVGDTILGTIDFGGGPLTGDGDIFVVKLDASGNHVWSRSFEGEGDDMAESVTLDAGGSIIFTGALNGTTSFGGSALTSAGAQDVLVVKLDASGEHVWSKSFGSPNYQLGNSVTTDPFGNVVLTGNYGGELSFGGDPLPSGAGSFDMFVAKLDPSGNHVWSKGFGGSERQTGAAVAITDAGDVIVAGSSSGQVDFGGGTLVSDGSDAFVAKLAAASGDYVWAKLFGASDHQGATSVAVDTAGSVILAGNFSGELDFGGGTLASTEPGDIFVAKLDAGANHVWSKAFGSADSTDATSAVTTDNDNNIIVTGRFGGTIDFGGGDITGAGDSDIFLVKLAP